MIAWTRVHAIDALHLDPTVVELPRVLHTRRNQRATRRNQRAKTRLNRGVESPINFVTIPSITSLHVAPHTGAHVVAWPPCHVAAPLCTSCAGHAGSATWPQCRVAPRGGPTCHVSRHSPRQLLHVKTPFFAILLIENTSKNEIKFGKRA